MILLRANNDDLRVTTGTTGSDIEITLSAMTADSAAPPALKGIPDLGPQASIVTNVTDQVLIDSSAVSGIASGDSIAIEQITAYNHHATVATTVEFNITDATVNTILAKANLLAGEKLEYLDGVGWKHYDSNGGEYPSVGNAATQADMEAGTATDRFVTPQGVNWHPGACKAWGKCTVSGGVPTLAVNWNTTSITDSGPSRLTVTIATDFSSANYSVNAMVEASSTTYSATTQSLITVIRNATQAAGSFVLDVVEIDIGQANDPAAWHFACFGDQ